MLLSMSISAEASEGSRLVLAVKTDAYLAFGRALACRHSRHWRVGNLCAGRPGHFR